MSNEIQKKHHKFVIKYQNIKSEMGQIPVCALL